MTGASLMIDDALTKWLEFDFFFSVLNQRGIFSGPANMSRLKAQLALDANKLWVEVFLCNSTNCMHVTPYK